MAKSEAKNIVFKEMGEDDEWHQYTISSRFLKFLERHCKLRVVRKLGEGMVKTGLKAVNLGNPDYPQIVVILVALGGYCEEVTPYNDYMLELRTLQSSGVLPQKDMMKIYEPIVCPYAPTSDKSYCPGVTRTSYTLQVVEYIDSILLEILYRHRFDTKRCKVAMVANIWQQLYKIYLEIGRANYFYGDVSSDNIGVRDGKLVMIDLSLEKETGDISNKKLFEQAKEDVIDSILFYYSNDDVDEAMKEGAWKTIGFVPFMSSKVEAASISKALNKLVTRSFESGRDYMIYEEFKDLHVLGKLL